MSAFTRTDTSVLGRWWWTVDRWILTAIALLLACGVLLVLAASPSVAERLSLNPYHMAWRQIVYILAACAVLFGVSLLSPRTVRRLAFIVFGLALFGTAATFFVSEEIKGARRWLDLGLLSVQPSEFIKPSLTVVAAWGFAQYREAGRAEGRIVAVGLFPLVIGLLILQPDIGMACVVAGAWFAQFLLAGFALSWAVALGTSAFGAMIAAYLLLPHVANRIDSFLDPGSGDSFQVDSSLQAFMNGGVLGRGPGEGTVKAILPDAHADFIFAVAGEEFGLIACLAILGLYAAVVLRGLFHALRETSLYVMIALTGLLVQFGLQAAVHMGSALRLIPAKGMTLPFISYGGSSMVAMALAMGMVLALTRRRVGGEPL